MAVVQGYRAFLVQGGKPDGTALGALQVCDDPGGVRAARQQPRPPHVHRFSHGLFYIHSTHYVTHRQVLPDRQQRQDVAAVLLRRRCCVLVCDDEHRFRVFHLCALQILRGGVGSAL